MSLETGQLLAVSQELNTAEPEQFRQWLTENAVHLTAGDALRVDGKITAIRLKGWNMSHVPIPEEYFERGTPPGKGHILTSAPLDIYCRPGDKYTAAFKTSGGMLGMFQVTDVDQSGKIHIRYKLVPGTPG